MTANRASGEESAEVYPIGFGGQEVRAMRRSCFHAQFPDVEVGANNSSIAEYSATADYIATGKGRKVRGMEKVKVQTPAGLLDEAKKRLVLTSDYKLALTLSWPVQTISGYRTGKRSMSVEHVREFARVTGIPLETVIDAAIAGSERKAENRRTVGRKAA